VIQVEFRCSRVYLKVHMSEFVYTSDRNRDYALCRNSGIHLFTTFCPFHTEITISRSLEGKYTFLGGSAGIRSMEVRIGDFRSNLGVSKGT